MISTVPAPAAAVSNPAVLEIAAGLFLIVLLVTKELIRTVINTSENKLLSGTLQVINSTLYLVMVPQFLVFVIIVSIKIYQVMP